MIQLLLNNGGGKDVWIQYLSVYLHNNKINHKIFEANKNLSMIKPENGPAAVLGLMRGSEKVLDDFIPSDQDFYYFDHPYIWPTAIRKPWILSWKRICKNCLSVNKLYDPKKINDADMKRISKHGRDEYLKSIKPWQKDGKHILLCPSSGKVQCRIERRNNLEEDEWLNTTIQEIKKHTDRPIKIKRKKDTKQIDFTDCFLCVTFVSMAAVEAVKAGVPSLCHPASCAAPVSTTDLAQVESPIYPDNRDQLIETFLLNQFNAQETKNGTAWEFINR